MWEKLKIDKHEKIIEIAFRRKAHGLSFDARKSLLPYNKVDVCIRGGVKEELGKRGS